MSNNQGSHLGFRVYGWGWAGSELGVVELWGSAFRGFARVQT